MNKSPRSQKKRAAILEAAGQLFCELGLHQVSMDMVASSAGVSKQTVYSHFTSKELLFAEAVGAKCHNDELSAVLLEQGTSVRESLLLFGRGFRRLVLSEQAINIFRTCVGSNDEQLSALFFEAGPMHVIGILEQWLERQKQLGLLHHPDSQNAALQLLLMWQGKDRIRRELGLPLMESPAQQEVWLNSCIDLFLSASSTPQS